MESSIPHGFTTCSQKNIGLSSGVTLLGVPVGKGWLGASLIKRRLSKVQKTEARKAREPYGVGSRENAPGQRVQEAEPPEALMFFNAETAFLTRTYKHKIVKFKTLLQTKIRQYNKNTCTGT